MQTDSRPGRWRRRPQCPGSARAEPLSLYVSVTLPSASSAAGAELCLRQLLVLRSMAASSSGEKEKERLGGGSGAAGGSSTRERLLSALEDLEVLSR